MRFSERLGEWGRRLRNLLVAKKQFDQDLEEEMRLHRDLRSREFQDAGREPDEARHAAQRRFGNTLRLREEIHSAWGWTWLDRLVLDLRYAVRRLRHSPGFTIVAALTLALGIGANTAIYSFMDSLLLRSLPVPDPSSLVVLKWHIQAVRDNGPLGSRTVLHGRSGWTYNDRRLGHTGGIFSFPAFELMQRNGSPFSTLFGYRPAYNLHVVAKEQAEIKTGAYVSGDFFTGLGIPPAAGRLIAADDDRAGTPAVAVVSQRFSQTHFGGPMNAVGQTIVVNHLPVTVVGVVPPGFFGVDPAFPSDLFFPLHDNVPIEASKPFGARRELYLAADEYWIQVMARLRPGVSMAEAQQVMAPQFHQWVASTASNDLERSNLPELLIEQGAGGLERLRRQYSEPLYVLLALVGLILAIACANVANLLLARATERRREMALRVSLGASRLRLLRQLLTESMLLACLGGAMGILFAIWGIRFLTLLLANGNPDSPLHADLNWHVLGMAAVLSMATGFLFGLAPALQSTRPDLQPALKEIRAGEAGRQSAFSLSRVLIVAQIALSLLMLVAAGLFLRTLSNLNSVELGFNQEKLLLFELNARQAGHPDSEITAFYDDLQKRFSVLPGVRSVSLSLSAMVGGGGHGTSVSVAGKPVEDSKYLTVGPGFFTTMQIPMLAGREISERDQQGSPGVAVINEKFARDYFRGQDPLGHHIKFGSGAIGEHDLEVIGISANARYDNLKDDIPPMVYVAYLQRSRPVDTMTFLLRTAGNPLTHVNAVREIVRQADSRVPVTDVRSQTAAIDRTLYQEILFAKLCTAFAVLALAIAAVGLYGTMSCNVARRTGEIGIRMALGAQRGNVVWMVLQEVFLLAAAGLAISVPTALVTSSFLDSFLFHMKPNDPLALTLAVVMLVTAALVAGWIPAHRASRIDPMIALRHE